ncbi:MAG: Polyketide cyclase / dehydrase and lipid transport [Myxococcales bacterium]|nr:Polyketide cyclase / dehydrase and lipid transport [Myxococcales bacterium]
MKHALDLFRFEGRVTRRQYVAAGVVLFAIKYAIDHLVSFAFGHPWNPLMYVSPRLSPLFRFQADARYWTTLTLLSLPFLWMGLSLTARRLRDVEVSPFWAGLFLAPFVHFVLFTALAVAPSRAAEPASTAPGGGGPFREGAPAPMTAPPRLLTRMIPREPGLAYLFAVVTSLAAALGCYVLTAQVNQLFGSMLFIALPFGMSFWLAFCMTYHRPSLKFKAAWFYGASVMLLAMLLLMTLGFEGMACVVMATPIIALVTFPASWLGWRVARDRRLADRVAPIIVMLMPLLVGVDLAHGLAPAPLAVSSRVLIHAPRETVWKNVIAFPPITTPPAPIFALVAMPLEARIDGHDPGATRRCIFTNGEFVEPIQVWDAPRELRFGVESMPQNIDEYASIDGGQFLLTDNGDGTTTLEGTTWYRLKVFPVAYWRSWTGIFLHAIHLRVLEHIARISEHPEAAVAAAPPQPAWMQAANETCACTRHASGGAR